MRTAPFIQELWSSGGPFIGDEKPNTVITVQNPWPPEDDDVIDGDEDHVIHPTTTKVGNYRSRGIPLRWFQKADNSQQERILPNVESVTIDRSIEADAATCNISLFNQWMRINDDAGNVGSTEIGIHGFFTPQHGQSPSAQARWGHEANEWESVIVPNAVLRTYQGFGGHDKELTEALSDGNLLLTGIWLIDDVRLDAAGRLQIEARDFGKLLIEQQLYPPLVPTSRYPLKYYRYVTENRQVAAAARSETITTSTNIAAGDKNTVFVDSAVDRWYPQGAQGSRIASGGFVLHGHKAVDCLDGNSDTFCLSVGNSGPGRPFTTDWWEFECNEHMNAVYVHPWGGNYTMYISVMENGAWQGSQTVPYDPSSLFGSQPYAVDTGANIPYVMSFGTPWETPREYVLDRLYNAQRVRVSFRDHTRSEWGPWYYRCGMREFRIRATNGAGQLSSSRTVTVPPLFLAGDVLQDPEDQNREGYITVSNFWQIDAFGDCRVLPVNTGPTATSSPAVGIALTPSANGYWVADNDGVVSAFGQAIWHGQPKDDGYVDNGSTRIADITATFTGAGYWVLTTDGVIYSYGDAADYSAPVANGQSFFFSIESHPTDMGYWVMDTNGKVTARGAATDFGDWSETVLNHSSSPTNQSAAAVNIRCTYEGDGYWILTDLGGIQAFGAATEMLTSFVAGDVNDFYNSYYELFPAPSNTGYLVMKGDGRIFPAGTVEYFGAPIPGQQGQIRKDGNYRDYVDIIKDLALWSGFLLLEDDIQDNEEPSVYGSLESTGAFSETPLPDDIFDKRPVIDAMTEIKETVGYLLFIDDEGRLHFESPNWWVQGNFDEDGNRLGFLPEVDERLNLTDYTVSLSDQSLRSLIIISSENPDIAGTTTIATKLVPQTAAGLKGLLVPAMWINGFFSSPREQKLMAELISLHIWFQQRVGQVSCVANPCIQINDQIRIYERTTSEAYIHFVRGVSSTHNLETGEYSMQLTTNWLGDGESWAITADQSYATDPTKFVVSDTIMEWIGSLPSRATTGFGEQTEDATWFGFGEPSEEDGSGPTEGI